MLERGRHIGSHWPKPTRLRSTHQSSDRIAVKRITSDVNRFCIEWENVTGRINCPHNDRVRATSRPPSAGRLRGDGSAASSPARVAPTCAMTHATVEEAGSWAASVRRWFDHEPALTGLCLVRAQHCEAGLAPRQPVFYRVEFDVESLLKVSHPLPGNDAKVCELLDQWLRGNHMGLNTPGSLTEFTSATTLKWS